MKKLLILLLLVSICFLLNPTKSFAVNNFQSLNCSQADSLVKSTTPFSISDPTTNEAWTIDFWMKTNQQSPFTVFSIPNALRIYSVTNGNLSVQLNGARGDSSVITGNVPVNDGQWHLIDIEYNGSAIWESIDNTLVTHGGGVATWPNWSYQNREYVNWTNNSYLTFCGNVDSTGTKTDPYIGLIDNPSMFRDYPSGSTPHYLDHYSCDYSRDNTYTYHYDWSGYALWPVLWGYKFDNGISPYLNPDFGNYNLSASNVTFSPDDKCPAALAISTIADVTANKNQVYNYQGSFTDLNSTSWTGTVDYGDGSGVQPLSIDQTNHTFSLNHLYQQTTEHLEEGESSSWVENWPNIIKINIRDNQGVAGLGYVSISVLHNQPATTARLAPNPDSQGEYPNPVAVTLSATADSNFSIVNTYYTIDGVAQQTYSTPFSITGTGSHTITYWSVDNAAPCCDNIGVEETPHKSQTFTISNTAIDTYLPAGQNQAVTIGNATLTFSDVTTAGYLVQTTSTNNQGGALPSEYKLLGTYYDLTTTATYSGSITITLSYDPTAVHNQNQLKLWHFDGTTWNDITTSVDTVNHTITGVTSSLSPFAIGEKDTTAPTVTNFQLNPYVVANGSSATISVSAQDDLTGVDTVSYSLTSSSGQLTIGDLSFISPSGVWQATVSPTTGVYAVKVTTTDFAGNQSTSDNLYLAVFDSSAGYVTGGGWVTPADATRVSVSSGAKTNFGFNVKYLSNNSSNPDGNFVLNDKQDELEVKSTSLEWLTVSGSAADFQGQATVNGSGSYTFRAHIVDGSPDQFDIRVWGNSNSFDNPNYRIANSLGGGSIVIHQ